MNKKKKNFNAVEMKRAIQAEIYQEIKHLSPEEEIEYYHKASKRGVFGSLFNTSHTKGRKSV